MTPAAADGVDPLGRWCGWVWVGAAGLAPLLAWLAPDGFAVLAALVGLLCLPALRIQPGERPLAVALLALLIWAAISSAWSPYRPASPDRDTALKLALQLPLYWSAVCGARRAEPRLAARAATVLTWGTAAFGLALVAEAASDAAIYERLHVTFYEPIRHDLAQVKVGHSSFVLALLWPLAAVWAIRSRRTAWLIAPMVVGAAAAALRFGSDAPALSLLPAAGVLLAARRWPVLTPKALAALAAAYIMLAPAAVWLTEAAGVYPRLQQSLPLSWSMRLGYWAHAADWLKDHPFRGWGLDASRMFTPGIHLHPHDGALQLWLELGLPGAMLAAVAWGLALLRLSAPEPRPTAAAACAAAAVYLLFGALNFGVWQEWWLGLGALAVGAAALLSRAAPVPPSTAAPISE